MNTRIFKEVYNKNKISRSSILIISYTLFIDTVFRNLYNREDQFCLN